LTYISSRGPLCIVPVLDRFTVSWKCWLSRKLALNPALKFFVSDKSLPCNMTNTDETPLFSSIGDAAQEVDDIDDDQEESQKLVEEIESMCINCEQNVPPRGNAG
jgi:hypothetical protein